LERKVPPHFFALISRQKNNEAARLHFTARSATSLKTEGFLHIFTIPAALLACPAIALGDGG
jgi:hypothetical protein